MPEVTRLTTANADEFIQNARSPLLIKFEAGWCAPCEAYAPVIEEAVAGRSGVVVLCAVDIEAEPELARRYGVSTVPAVVLLRDTTVVKRIYGARTQRFLRAQLDELMRSR